MCHDQFGNININQSGTQPSGETLIQIYFTSQPGMNICQQRIENMRNSYGGYQLASEMPVLSLPESLMMAGGSLNTRGSGSNGTVYSSRASLAVDMPVAEIAEAFAPILEEQGWQLEAQIAGKVAANSIWMKQAENENGESYQLIGMLIMVEQQEHEFHLEFQISRKGAGSNMNRPFMGVVGSSDIQRAFVRQ